MANITMKQMLQAGLHFGHQTRRWNPKMKPYIYGPRNDIYIINLDKTMGLFNRAYDFVVSTIAKGGDLLLVGTKRQARDIIREESERCGMHYINHRWLGGALTNFQTIRKGIERLKAIEAMQEDGSINRFPKKEILLMEKERVKLTRNIGGIKMMRGLPSAIFVVDPRKEHIAVQEAIKLDIPVIGLADTNCNPDGLDFIIPGNDDAIRSIRLITAKIADAVLEGREKAEGQAAVDAETEEPMAAAEPEATEEAEGTTTEEE